MPRATKGCTQRPSHAGSRNPAIMEGRLDLFVRQAFEHQPHHAQIHPRFAGSKYEFILLAHPPVARDPRNRALNNPAVWYGVEAQQAHRRLLVRAQPPPPLSTVRHDLQPPAEYFPYPGLQVLHLRTIGPDQLQARQGVRERQQQSEGADAVLHVSWVDQDAQHQVKRINKQASFAFRQLHRAS